MVQLGTGIDPSLPCVVQLLTLLTRDGDTVSIRMSENGDTLIIRDNHSPDASTSPATPAATFIGEAEEKHDHNL